MTAETDAEFVERIESRWMIAAPEADITRLFALARRGAAVQWRPSFGDFVEGCDHLPLPPPPSGEPE
jgi:hypothetical protein